MDEHRPRFEFRVWGADVAERAARLRSLTSPTEIRDSVQRYIVAAGVTDVNAKVRFGALDVKVLLTEVDGFEQWDPWLNVDLPVGADVLTERLFPRLGVTTDALGRAMYEMDQLETEVLGPHPDLHVVEVSKHRDIREGRGCLAEVANVVIAGNETQTLAIESVDIDLLAAFCSRLGLEDHANVNYQRAIQLTLGIPEG